MENTARQIRIINPTKRIENLIRVAAYCRVSSDSADQANSFCAQVRYYSDYIRCDDRMTLVDIYADEGITGTEIIKRDEFKRMMKDAKNRKIDRILVKSVTRFARNSLECLESIRALKSYGTSVYFENDHIDTALMNSEMIVYIKSAFAQNEAMSASRRMALSNRMRMEDGTYINPSIPYGYRLKGGVWVIEESEAANVREIYRLYLEGYGDSTIVRIMTARPDNDKIWKVGLIRYILINEKYIGDTLFQKRFTPSVLPLRIKRNKGELPQYYIENSHEAIIERDIFEKVKQLRRERGEKFYNAPTPAMFLQGKIYCRHCGWVYKKRMRGNELFWTCTRKGQAGIECHSLTYSESEIKAAFVQMYNTLKQNEKTVIDETIAMLNALKVKVNAGNSKIAEMDAEIASLAEQNSVYAELYASGIIDEITYLGKTDKYKNRITELRSRRLKLINEDEDELCIEKLRELKRFLADSAESIGEYDEKLFLQIFDKIFAESDGALTFHLKCELELKIYVRR